MSVGVVEKLQTIAENVQKVYDNGFQNGFENAKSDFWVGFTDYNRRMNYRYAFAFGWYDDFLPPATPIKIKNGYDADCMFYFSTIGNVDEKIVDFSKQKIFYRTFAGSRTTDVTIDVASAKVLEETFRDGHTLLNLTIKNLSADCKFVNTFGTTTGYGMPLDCLNLTGTIGQDGFDLWSAIYLSRDSIINVMNALSTTTNGFTVRLAKRAVDSAFETEEGANDGSTSAEWLALVNSRPNWVVSFERSPTAPTELLENGTGLGYN